MPCDIKAYGPDWKKTVARILARAGHKCEQCGVHNHAVGYREPDGTFMPLAGNGPCDAAGVGKTWPGFEPLSYAEAKEFADNNNDCRIKGIRGALSKPCDADGNRWLVVVLTVAHLDHKISNNEDSNLKAWCQRCHNRHDIAHRQGNAKVTRARKAALQPALMEVA